MLEKKRFELDPKVSDQLSDLFLDLVVDGGTMAVEDILNLLAESLEQAGEMAYDQARTELGRAVRQKYQALGNELRVISQRIQRFIESGFIYA